MAQASATFACRSACRAWRLRLRGAATAPVTGAPQRRRCSNPCLHAARPELFEDCRKQLGDEVELLHDVHERVSPTQARAVRQRGRAVQAVLPRRPALAGGHRYFRQIRQQCTTPIAMGELFNSPHEWTPLIAERLIDYIRVHVSQAGGLTPCRKIATFGELFGVKTAWHGPGDVSPIGTCRNVTLDLASYNFGIQESVHSTTRRARCSPAARDEDGYLCANDAPGWGIEVDEKPAAKYPFRAGGGGGGERQPERRLGRHPAPGRHGNQAVGARRHFAREAPAVPTPSSFARGSRSRGRSTQPSRQRGRRSATEGSNAHPCTRRFIPSLDRPVRPTAASGPTTRRSPSIRQTAGRHCGPHPEQATNACRR